MNSLWLGHAPLILASKSPARRLLLQNAGIPLQIKSSDIDERAIETELVKNKSNPLEIAQALSRQKAMFIRDVEPGQLILSCDQTLDLSGQVFSKPVHRKDAENQLHLLSGQVHHLHSAATLMLDGAVIAEPVASVRLKMRPLQKDLISAYLDLVGEAASSSVGGYQIEGLGIHLFDVIEGDHFSIMGLPLIQILKIFRDQGFLKT